ncbi:Penicillin amidase [Variovorax sp. PDC80]|nr:Penicillin amidase [Variovorax sp. PDC80]
MKRTPSPRPVARRIASPRSGSLAMRLVPLAALLALAGCASGPPAETPQSTSTPSRAPSSFAVPGLEKPAEVLVDRWGVPHLYAGTLYDAFVAQGFIAARDRLWQMDLWRKRGLGEMAQDFGPAWVESDRAARAVLYRGDMYREWLAYGSDAKRVAEAFTAGVNAYVAQVRAQPDLLPQEFKLLGYQPATKGLLTPCKGSRCFAKGLGARRLRAARRPPCKRGQRRRRPLCEAARREAHQSPPLGVALLACADAHASSRALMGGLW